MMRRDNPIDRALDRGSKFKLVDELSCAANWTGHSRFSFFDSRGSYSEDPSKPGAYIACLTCMEIMMIEINKAPEKVGVEKA